MLAKIENENRQNLTSDQIAGTLDGSQSQGGSVPNRNSTTFGDNEMGKIKFGRALGLSILGALSMMAMFVVSAQAAEPGLFEVNGSTNNLLATATGSQEGAGTLLVPGRNLSLTCNNTSVGAGSEIIKNSEGLGVVTFSNCTALSHKTGGELPCTVDNPTAKAILLPVKHGTGKYVTAEPDGTATFTTVFLLGELCPLPEENPVTGKVSAQVTTNNAVINLITANPTISTLLSDTLAFGGFPATITANATIELTGAHAGMKFGVV